VGKNVHVISYICTVIPSELERILSYLGGPSFGVVDVPGAVRSKCIGVSGQNVPSAGVDVGVAGYAVAADDSL